MHIVVNIGALRCPSILVDSHVTAFREQNSCISYFPLYHHHRHHGFKSTSRELTLGAIGTGCLCLPNSYSSVRGNRINQKCEVYFTQLAPVVYRPARNRIHIDQRHKRELWELHRKESMNQAVYRCVCIASCKLCSVFTRRSPGLTIWDWMSV